MEKIISSQTSFNKDYTKSTVKVYYQQGVNNYLKTIEILMNKNGSLYKSMPIIEKLG